MVKWDTSGHEILIDQGRGLIANLILADTVPDAITTETKLLELDDKHRSKLLKGIAFAYDRADQHGEVFAKQVGVLSLGQK